MALLGDPCSCVAKDKEQGFNSFNFVSFSLPSFLVYHSIFICILPLRLKYNTYEPRYMLCNYIAFVKFMWKNYVLWREKKWSEIELEGDTCKKKKASGALPNNFYKKKHVSFSWIQEMICSQSLLSKPKRKIMLLPRALISMTLLQVSITLILLPFPEAHLNWCPIFLNLNSLQETMCNKCFTKATGDSRNFIIQFPRYQHNISV